MRQSYLLLVEDNPDDIFLTRRTLCRGGLGYELETVEGVHEAMDHLEAARHLPAAVLVSYGVSRFAGLELIERLRRNRRTRDLPLVLVTSSADERDHVCGVVCTTAADACLVKPLAAEELGRCLRGIEYRRGQALPA